MSKEIDPHVLLGEAPALEVVQTAGRRRGRIQAAEARAVAASLARAGFAACDASIVGGWLAPEVGRSTVYTWQSPESLGPRLPAILQAPPTWARILLRGALAHVEGRCGRPSRVPLVVLLTRAAALLAAAHNTPPARLPDDQLRERIETLRQTRDELDAELADAEAEQQRRALERRSLERTGQEGA